MKILKFIIKFIYSFFNPKKGNEIEIFKPRFSYKHVKDLPLIIGPDIIYIIGENSMFWMLGFKCPCGCESTINLNLLEESFPCWNFNIESNYLITLSPSIRRIKGCKSHFFIQKGCVIWA